jgi:hypothetical protein
MELFHAIFLTTLGAAAIGFSYLATMSFRGVAAITLNRVVPPTAQIVAGKGLSGVLALSNILMQPMRKQIPQLA